jgi:hypothetical protein
MNWSDIPWNPSQRTLRQFAALWMIFFAALACSHGFLRGHAALAAVFAVLAVTIGPLGLVRPQAIRPIFVGLTVATFPIGWVVSLLVLAGLFYGVFTPIGLVFRLIGRDPLQRQSRPHSDSYWVPKVVQIDPQSYFRTF